MQSHALVSYTGTGTRLGLELLAAQRVDASCLHWRPLDESPQRHPALLQNHTKHQNWVLVRTLKRERVMIIHLGLKTADRSTEALPRSGLKWGIRQEGKGTLHFLNEILTQYGMKNKDLYTTVNIISNSENAAMIVLDQADVTPKRGVLLQRIWFNLH